MTGDASDITTRLFRLLPPSWFPSDLSGRPVLDMVLQGTTMPAAHVYALIEGATEQARISTATSIYLDLIAGDFFGSRIRRRAGQSDASFRGAILANLFKEKGTRRGMELALEQLTGNTPTIIELWRPWDTGVYAEVWDPYAASVAAFDVAGAYGDIDLPWHALVNARRPITSGIPNVAGYRDLADAVEEGVTTGQYYGLGAPPSDPGLSAYNQLDDLVGFVSDEDIYETINDVRPAAVTVWARIS